MIDFFELDVKFLIPPLDYEIFCKYTGICGYQKMKQKDIAAEYGMGRTSVSNSYARTLKKVRRILSYFGKESLDDF